MTNEDAIVSSANTVFKYAKPTVTSVTSVDTGGGSITITGTNFGVVGTTVDSVTLNSAGVTSPSVTVDHTTIVGTFSTAGTGKNYPAIVTIGSQASATNTLFSYNAPTVTSVTTRPSIFGGSLVLAGTNLGPTGLSSAKISVTVTGDGTTTCSAPSVTAHTALTCTITCSTVCSGSARDVTVTIDSQSTTSSGILTYEGPVITSIPAVSYHGVLGTSPVVITGRNFGDGTYINYIKICALSAISDCSGSATYSYGKEFETASSVSVVTSGTQIQGFTKEHVGDDYSVVVSVNNIESTGGDALLDYTGPTITVDSSNYITDTVPTSGGTMTVTGTNFGPTGTSNIMKIVWDSSSTVVTPSGSSATVSTANTQITFTAPAGAGSKTFSLEISNNGTTEGALVTNAAIMKYEQANITSITSSSTAGSTITITGTNFGPVGASNIDSLTLTDSSGTTGIAFTDATVSVANTQITATAPAGSGTGLDIALSIGSQASDGGTGIFGYSVPAITSIAPIATGPSWTTVGYGIYNTQQGAWITVTGSNFGPTASITSLTIGGVECLYPYVTTADSKVMCLFGAGAGANYDVVFTIDSQTVTGGSDAFSYSAPTVTSSTSTSYFGGGTITITGTNFGPKIGDTDKKLPTGDPTVSVTIAGNACTSPVVTVAHTEMTCTAPAFLDELTITGQSLVVTAEGQSVTSTFDYTGPAITSVTDVSMFGGTVTVTGTNFGPVGTANIGSLFIAGIQQTLSVVEAEVTVENTEIQFTSPSGTGSNVNVKIFIRTQGTGDTGNGLLSYLTPNIASVSSIPTGGGTVTITGTNFGPVGTTQIDYVTIGGTFCTSASVTVDGTAIECTFQGGTGGGYDVVIKLNDETDQGSGAGKFSYNAATVSTVTPASGGQGTLVTITGADFGPDESKISVKIGDVACTNVTLVTSDTEVTFTAPLGTGNDQIVYVTVDGVTNTDSARFSYSAPTVTAVTNVGPMGGNVTITGTFFGPVGSSYVTSVKFGQGTCADPYVTVLQTEIVCTLPKALLAAQGGQFSASDLDGDGLMDVVATINGQASTGGEAIFAFNKPMVSSISPMSAAKDELITISGANFGDGPASIKFKMLSTYATDEANTYEAATTIADSIADTEIVAKMPTGFGAIVRMSLLINDREASYTDLLEANGDDARNMAYKPPTVTATEPPPSTAGGAIIVNGTGFGPLSSPHLATQVDTIKISSTAGDMTCTNGVVTIEDTQLTCDVLSGTGMGYDVTVTVDGQDSGTTGAGLFRYPTPVVYSVAPVLGKAGDTIVVTGTNFGAIDDVVTVKVEGDGDSSCGGTPCTTSSVVRGSDHVQVQCVVPVSVGKEIPVIVEINGQASEANGSHAHFSYDNPIIGTVTQGHTKGSVITITGQNFGREGECYQNYFESIDIGGNQCTDAIVTVSGTELACLAPEGIGTGHDVTVTMRGASSGDSGQGKFDYFAPNVTSTSFVPTYGGSLQIFGTDFGPVSNETIPTVAVTSPAGDAVPCTNITVTTAHEEITCDFPAGTGAGYDVLVAIGGQDSNDTGIDIMSYHPPVLTSISPMAQTEQDLLYGSTTITVVGTNMGTDYTKVQVMVGSQLADQDSVRLFQYPNSNDVEVVARVPDGAGEGIAVTVITDGVESIANDNVTFSYLAPFVTNVTSVGTAGGSVEIFGSNFGAPGTVPAIVTLGGLACDNPTTTENSTIVCDAPPGVGKDLDVFIQIGENQTKSTFDTGDGKFRYLCPEVSQVDYIPDSSWSASGQTVTVTGLNFGHKEENITVKIRKPEYLLNVSDYSGNEYFETTDLALDQDFGTPNEASGFYRMTFTVPPGFGKDLPVVVDVAGQDSNLNCAIPKALPLGDLKDSAKLYTYARPIITNVSSVATEGGVLTLDGYYFGPLGSEGIDNITITDSAGDVIPCSGPTVVEADVQAQCMLSAGVGKDLPTSTSIGQYESVEKSIYSYDAPSVLAIVAPNGESSSPVVSPGDLVTVNGTNFGTDSSLVRVALLRKLSFDAANVQNVSTAVNITIPHKQLTFVAPVSSGVGTGVAVYVPSGANVSSSYTAVNELGINEPTFSYAIPNLTSVSSVATTGGKVLIDGTGFGSPSLQPLPTVTIGGKACPDVEITVPDTQIMCSVPEGTGKDLDVVIDVDAQSQTFLAQFAYRVPEVDAITPSTALAGEIVTVTGSSFGSQASMGAGISLALGNFTCENLQITTAHAQMQCIVPSGEGIEVPVVATVNGQASASSVVFTYDVGGCTNATGTNYNSLATKDDGSCIFMGCTRAASPNYAPWANRDDGSCIMDPVEVEMKVQLDFAEYEADPVFHQTVFKNDLASQLGVNASRIMITGATPGSTVFAFYILDDPAKPATEVAEALETKILNNDFEITYTVVEVKTKVYGEPEGEATTITTKAGEPRVSVESIIGIGACLGFILIWGLFYKSCIRYCQNCFGAQHKRKQVKPIQTAAYNGGFGSPVHSGYGLIGPQTV